MGGCWQRSMYPHGGLLGSWHRSGIVVGETAGSTAALGAMPRSENSAGIGPHGIERPLVAHVALEDLLIMVTPRITRRALPAVAVAAAIAATAGVAHIVRASDHQDTPEVELSPRSDLNDVFAFPAGLTSTDNIVLVMTTSSPIVPANSSGARFDPALLYQFKIDNNADGKEDQVIQITFGGDSSINGASGQLMRVRGPSAPASLMAPDGSPATPPLVGTATVALRNVPVITGVTGALNVTGGTNGNIKVYAGLRDDPFYIDLEQFFKIIPDRRPATGPLAAIPETPTATGFRNPGTDLLTAVKANTLAIVVELPKTLLTAGNATTGKIGVWGTISR